MSLFRKNRRFIAWLACIAILLNSLAPAISHAMATTQDKAPPWTQICSVPGTKSITLDLDQASSKQDKKRHQDSQPISMDHCAYCLTHAGSFGLTLDGGFSLKPINLSYDLPKLFYHAPRPLFVWSASNPRAPPTLP